MRFDLLRVDILAVGQDDEFLHASCDEEIAARIEMAEISGVQPSVVQGLGRCIQDIPIALHDNRAADRNFAAGRTAILGRLWIEIFPSMVSNGGPTEPITTFPGGFRKAAGQVSVQAVRV